MHNKMYRIFTILIIFCILCSCKKEHVTYPNDKIIVTLDSYKQKTEMDNYSDVTIYYTIQNNTNETLPESYACFRITITTDDEFNAIVKNNSINSNTSKSDSIVYPLWKQKVKFIKFTYLRY